jgi:hypothetical protein
MIRPNSFLLLLFAVLGSGIPLRADPPVHRISWTNNVLTLDWPGLPGGPVPIWYLEAFLRPGAHDRVWGDSVMPHRTTLKEASADGRRLEFLTRVDPGVEVRHTVECVEDGLAIDFAITRNGEGPSDLQWFQPACIRVGAFTGRSQTNFTGRAFVFTTNGLTTLDATGRTLAARYLGGQVFPMPGVPEADANPRPIARMRPVNGLIGCISSDDRWILATASDRTHELFEGVYVCLHSDPAVGGLGPGETKRVRQRIYVVPNDPEALLRRYRRDFPEGR